MEARSLQSVLDRERKAPRGPSEQGPRPPAWATDHEPAWVRRFDPGATDVAARYLRKPAIIRIVDV